MQMEWYSASKFSCGNRQPSVNPNFNNLPCTSLSWHSFSLDHNSLKKSPVGSAELGLPQLPPDAFILLFSAPSFFDLFAELAHSHTLSFKLHSYEAVSEDRCMPVMTDRQHLGLHLLEYNLQPWTKYKAYCLSLSSCTYILTATLKVWNTLSILLQVIIN